MWSAEQHYRPHQRETALFYGKPEAHVRFGVIAVGTLEPVTRAIEFYRLTLSSPGAPFNTRRVEEEAIMMVKVST
jgi:hypothetical protein